VLSVKRDPAGIDLVGVTHVGQPPNRKASAVTILASNRGAFTIRSEFTLPEGTHLSPVSNLLFHPAHEVAYVGSSNGIIFSISTSTGESEGHQIIGGEFRALELSRSGDAVIVVRSTARTDQIAVFGLKPVDIQAPATRERVVSPQISSVTVDEAQQGLVIDGENFRDGLVVELLSGGTIVSQYNPVAVAERRLLVLLPRDKFEGLDRLSVRLTQISRISSQIVAIERPRRQPPTAPIVAVAPSQPVPGPSAPPKLMPDEPKQLAAAPEPTPPETRSDESKQLAAAAPVPTLRETRTEAVKPPDQPRMLTAQTPVLAVALKPKAAGSKPAVVRSVNAQVVKGALQVSVKMDGQPSIKDFTLSEPNRIVVDLLGVSGNPPNRTMQVGLGPIERVRVGQPSPGVVRIVIDTKVVVPYAVALERGILVIQANTSPNTARINQH
jgi:hypothetical protein